MYLYENIEGIGGDGRYVPIGLAMGSQENCMLALEGLADATEPAPPLGQPGEGAAPAGEEPPQP